MATAKLVCGECSAVLSQGDKFCPQCGSTVDRPAGLPAGSPSSAKCPACGNEVHPSARFCESCGVELKKSDAHQHHPQAKDQEGQRKNSGSGAKTASKKKSAIEPWQIATGVVVVGLVVFFVYSESNRQQPVTASSPVQEMLPAQSAGLMREIEQLQQTVDANPADESSVLRLANMLHDAAMSNPELLTRAINTYSKYLKMKPGDPNARVDMGICYFQKARVDTNNSASLFASAIREMETAIKTNPNHQPAAFNLGIVNLNAGNLEKSTEWFNRAMSIDPNSDLGKKAKQLVEQHSFQGTPN